MQGCQMAFRFCPVARRPRCRSRYIPKPTPMAHASSLPWIQLVLSLALAQPHDHACAGDTAVQLSGNITFQQEDGQGFQGPDQVLLSWGEPEFSNLDCVVSFVLSDEQKVLCPNFLVTQLQNGTRRGCRANFTQEQCHSRILVTLEAWTANGTLIQASSHIWLQCPEVTAMGNATCSWGPWSEWGACSVTCGSGRRVRRRAETGHAFCRKRDTDLEECLMNSCPTHCAWSQWAEWSSCSQTCGTGVVSRSRHIQSPETNGGWPCQDSDGEEVTSCAINDCPVDGGWSEWSHWGYCSVTCGRGSRQRSRRCDSPHPENGGLMCEGRSEEDGECSLKTCLPVHGHWSSWSRWSECSTTCGRGSSVRRRSCTHPAPAYGGRNCEGSDELQKPCFLGQCPETPQQGWLLPTPSPPYVTSTLTATPARSGANEADSAAVCREAPVLLGFHGPLDSRHHQLKVLLGSQHAAALNTSDPVVFYFCRHHRVLDVVTNRNFFHVHCSNFSQISSAWMPTAWPQCVDPLHCIGPAWQPLAQDEVWMPVPRSDAAINERIQYSCKQAPKQVSASCFSDGKIRYPKQLANCSQDVRVICNSSGTNDHTSAVFIDTAEQEFGWVEVGDYPNYASLNQSLGCEWAFRIPEGQQLRVGFEDVSLQEEHLLWKRPRFDLDGEGQAQLEIVDMDRQTSETMPLRSMWRSTWKSTYERLVLFRMRSPLTPFRLRLRMNFLFLA